jgi:predicted GNAT superfamily acetyltransferase
VNADHEAGRGWIAIRGLRAQDYDAVIGVLDEWWGGRQMAPMLPRLFFDHFHGSGLAAERDGRLVGFLVGFRSQAEPGIAYIHFVGVSPELRGRGVGRTLYERFFEDARLLGCTTVRCVTSPTNTSSVAFHRSMGFSDRLHPQHDGPGADRVVFERALT